MSFLKDLITGTSVPAIAAKFVVDAVMAILRKLDWGIVLERFMTRIVVYGLRKLAAYSSNEVVDQTVEDVLAMLRDKKLPEAK